MAKITIRKFKKALDGSYGIISLIAKRMNVSREAVYKFMKKYPQTQEMVKMERDKIVDIAETKLFKKIQEGEWKAIEFTLRNLGSERGYAEKHIIDTNISNISLQDIENQIKKIIKEVDKNG
ncbi:MAG: hypothetical protein ACTSQG_10320 [Promethearchaeota archaeon]